MTDVDKLNQAITKGKIDTPIYAFEIDGDTVRITTPYRAVTVDLSSSKKAPVGKAGD